MANNNFYKIMLVDDTVANLSLLSEVFSKENYEIKTANSGELALSAMKAEIPDLVILDIKMPGIDGFEVCHRMKSDKHLSQIPIIFISVLDDVSDKVKAFEAGAVDYINKPFEEKEVLIRAKTHLELGRLTKELKISEKKYRFLISSMNQGFALYEIVTDNKGAPAGFKFIDINDSFEKIAGLKRINILGKTVLDVFPKTDNSLIENYRKIALTGESMIFENYSADIGKYFYISAYFLKEDQIAAIFFDITERKKSEELMKQKIDEINKINMLMTDRELKMIELKQEVVELKAKLKTK